MKQKISKKDARLLKREIKLLTYRAKGQGEKERARRVLQMVTETIKPENGVIMQYELMEETARGIAEFEAEDRERALEEEDNASED